MLSAAEPRPVRPADTAAIARLAARAFPATQAAFVRAGREGFVVDGDRGLAAAVLVRVIDLPGGQRIGFVSWAMTDPEHKGRGLAPDLAARGIERLEELGCERIVTEMEGYNAASEAAFRKLGFRRIGLRDQLSAFGFFGAAWARLRIGYSTDPGHFLWMRGAEPAPHSEAGQRALAWSLNGLFALAAWSLGGGILLGWGAALPAGSEAALMLLAVALVLGAREAAMRLAARARGLSVTFRAWDSGMGITAGIAGLFGQLFPLPGSVYPSEPGWRAREAGPALAAAALAGTAAVAAIVAAALWAETAQAGSWAGAFVSSVLFIAKPLLLFDAAMAFPPFQAFNARRIYEVYRGPWLAVAAVGLVLFLL